MNEGGNFSPLAAGQVRLWPAFAHASALGFAVFDDRLRYRVLNGALAAINGIPASEHLGNTIADLFGHVIAEQIEPRVKRLVATGQPVDVEINATLPTRSEPGFFIDHYFPLKGMSAKASGIGLVVVEVTQQRKLDRFIHQLAGDVLRRDTRNAQWLARELHDSVDQYHFALARSIAHLTDEPDRSSEILAETVQLLDQRILAIRTLVAAVANGLPVLGNAPS